MNSAEAGKAMATDEHFDAFLKVLGSTEQTAIRRAASITLALLVLPLYVPVLIFGAGAVLEQMAGIETMAQIYWLGVITMASLTLAPFAVQAALRVSLEQ